MSSSDTWIDIHAKQSDDCADGSTIRVKMMHPHCTARIVVDVMVMLLATYVLFEVGPSLRFVPKFERNCEKLRSGWGVERFGGPLTR